MSRRLLLPIALLLAGCADRTPPVRIGIKSFTEQRILGEMLTTLLRQGGVEVAPLVECDETWRCHQALREGRVDVLVDYTGTGLNFVGAPPGEATLARVRALYAPAGIAWLAPLGFDNGYRVLVPPDAPDGLRTIGGLAAREALRVAVPGEYLRRPRDGLAALASRYGLRLAPEPVVVEDPTARYEAVRAGRADVAIGYATDGAIRELGFVALDDPLGFFPPYEAVIVARQPLLDARPALAERLRLLTGRIDTPTMRALDARVQIEGRDPAAVARAWLVDAGLVDPDAVEVHTGPEVVLAHPSGGGLAEHLPRARRAVRAAFPDRPVRVEAARAPAERLTTGDARLAVLDAAQVFRWSVRRRRWVRDDRLEAIAVLGERRVHLVRRAGDPAAPLAGPIGVEAGAAGRVPRAMLEAMDLRPARRAPAAALLDAVRDGVLDGALVFAAPGDPTVRDALAAGGLALRGLDGWLTVQRALRLPFLRLARLPAAAYPGVDRPVETLGAQVVLAGPAPGGALAHGGGPAAALPAGGAPLDAARVRALVDALGVTEAPDPALPSAWKRSRGAVDAPEPEGWREALEVCLNLFALGFTAWLGWLLVASPRRPEA